MGLAPGGVRCSAFYRFCDYGVRRFTECLQASTHGCVMSSALYMVVVMVFYAIDGFCRARLYNVF